MATYQTVTTVEGLDALFERSRTQPVLLFKHSLTCGVSAQALREASRWLQPGDADHVVLEVQTSRALSGQLAERTGIRHESPQVMVLRDGKVAWHASHWAITSSSLDAQLEASEDF